MLNDLHPFKDGSNNLVVLFGASSGRRRRPPSSIVRTVFKFLTPSAMDLLLGGFGRCRSGRWSWSCSSRRSRCWSWSLNRFRLWLRRLFFAAADSHDRQIDNHHHCEKKKNPLLHVGSPPF